MKYYLNRTKQSYLCKNEIRETDLFHSIKSRKNNKTPGNDGLIKQSHKTF